MTAVFLAVSAILVWLAVWAGAIGALYQAALVLAGAVGTAAAVQYVLRAGMARRIARSAGFVATTLLIAELCALALHLSGVAVPLQVRFRDGDRTMSRDNARLGFGPDADHGAVRSIKRRPDRSTVCDVTYTLGDGLRVTKGDRDGPCTVLFMIDSVAFGVGVDDADTLPQRFSEATGFRLNVVNLAYGGYGPQQVLAWLDGPAITRFIRSPVAAAYYISSDDHVLRIAGLTDWSRFDPRFALIDGEIARTGRFHSPPSLASWHQFRTDFTGFLSASTFFHYAVRRVLPERPGRIPAARALYLAALKRADALLRRRHGVPLTVLVWHSGALTEPALAVLARGGVPVLRFDTMVGPPGREYRIVDDGHPTPLANRRWADMLARTFPGCPPR